MRPVSRDGPQSTPRKRAAFPADLHLAPQQWEAADKEKGDPFEGIALESTGVVLGGDKQEKQEKQ